MDVQGRTAPGFEKVAEVFAANFARYGEVGAAFAAYRDGEPLVDLWAGVTDPGTGQPWQADTLQLVFSGAKGLTSACVLLLVERGLLELDAPAARYWPEFAAAGKERITVAEILSHQARLPGVQQPVDTEELLNPEHMATLLAAQAPTTDPRAAFVYHALTWGWLTGELVRRVDGRTVGALFADEFAGPLGLDIWLGLPDTEHHRVATTIAGPGVLRPKDEDEDEERDALQVLTRNPLLTADAPALWNSMRLPPRPTARRGRTCDGPFDGPLLHLPRPGRRVGRCPGARRGDRTARAAGTATGCLAVVGHPDGVRRRFRTPHGAGPVRPAARRLRPSPAREDHGTVPGPASGSESRTR